MPQMAYVSCRPEDRAHADKIMDWWRQGQLGSGWTLAAGAGEGRGGTLSVHLLNATALILIVGAGTAAQAGVDDEVNHALTQRKKLLLVRPPGGTGALPRLAEGRPVCDFHPAKIRAALEK
jgi:hypothetical protein